MRQLFSYIQKMFSSFSKKELFIFLSAAVFFIASGVLLTVALVDEYTIQTPTDGGTFKEGIVGQVGVINPILAQDNTPDKDIVSLLFSNIPTIAERINYDEEYKVWNIRIKEGALWHDDTPITTDDIIFTVQTIKNPQTASPLFDIWKNVSLHRISEREMEFHLLDSYALFENVLRELYPVPKHLFEDIAPANIKLSSYNLRPIGSGPFEFKDLSRRSDGFIQTYTLSSADTYKSIAKKAYINTLSFLFFEKEEQRIQAFNSGVINALGTFDYQYIDDITIKKNTYDIDTRRYYALFFNTTVHGSISEDLRRELISLIDQKTIVDDVFFSHADRIEGPLDVVLETEPQEREKSSSIDQILQSQGWVYENDQWKRGEGEEQQTFSLTITVPDVELLTQTASAIISQWNQATISADMKTVDPILLSEEILPSRDYDMLLFGNILLTDPDPSSFWHSNEIFYPGQNFSLLKDNDLDTRLAQIKRTHPHSEEYTQLLQEVNEMIQNDAAAAFLLSPHYLYITSPTTHPPLFPEKMSFTHDRFTHIPSWYVKTTRTFQSSQPQQ